MGINLHISLDANRTFRLKSIIHFALGFAFRQRDMLEVVGRNKLETVRHNMLVLVELNML